MFDIDEKNAVLSGFYKMIDEQAYRTEYEKLKVGVDLGTANIVVAVVDEKDRPVAGAMQFATVIKDGLVVDYIKAVDIVAELKQSLEQALGVELDCAAAAVPPGTEGGARRIVPNVLEAAGFEVTQVVDEPTAAAKMLDITDGAVVDVGGGTTGITNMIGGKVASVYDEPTGGTHMTLTIAGHYGIDFFEAENLKRDTKERRKIFPLISPVVEKMASIACQHVDKTIEKVYLVGGACDFDRAPDIFQMVIGKETIKPAYPLLVTPLGIAMCSDFIKMKAIESGDII